MLATLSTPTKQKKKKKKASLHVFQGQEKHKNLNKKNRRSSGRTWTRRHNFMAHMSSLLQKLGMIGRPLGPSRMKR